MIRRFSNPIPVLIAAQVVSHVGCQKFNANDKPTVPVLADAAPAPALTSSNKPAASMYQQDALWRQAIREGDDIDLASLASREGASGLLQALEEGGAVGRTALQALPFAEDAPVAYRRLCEVALMTRDAAQQQVLRSIRDIAAQPGDLREPVDNGGLAACAEALLRMGRDVESPEGNRALAISTLRLPAFSSLVASEQVSTSLDTPASSSSSQDRQ